MPPERSALAVSASRLRALGVLSAISLLASLAAMFLAVLAYPGGSWADRDARGFRPLVNYWCDLMRNAAVNGEANVTSAILARGAFTFLAASLSAFWWVAAARIHSARLARWAIVSGSLASASLAFTALLAYDAHPWAHTVATLSAGCTGLLATSLLLAGHVQSGVRSPWCRVFAAGLVASAAANIAVYVEVVAGGDRDSAVLPVVQTVATLFLVLWMAASLSESLSAPAPDGGAKRVA